MIRKSKGQFQVLLGQTVVSLDRIALIQGNEISPLELSDTILFTLTDHKYFELLVNQDSVQLQEPSEINELFASFELEPSEELGIYSLQEIIKTPHKVESLTEIWAGKGEKEFMVAVSFWGKDKQHIISICTEGDEAELMSLEELWQRVKQMTISYGILTYYFYTNSSNNLTE